MVALHQPHDQHHPNEPHNRTQILRYATCRSLERPTPDCNCDLSVIGNQASLQSHSDCSTTRCDPPISRPHNSVCDLALVEANRSSVQQVVKVPNGLVMTDELVTPQAWDTRVNSTLLTGNDFPAIVECRRTCDPHAEYTPMATALCDEELFARYRGGDDSAFTTLHNRYAPALHRYVTVKLRCDSSTGDEIVQRVFIKITKCKMYFTTGKRFQPWIYTIADNLSKDWSKVSKRRLKKIIPFPELCDGTAKEAFVIDDNTPAPDEAVINKETMSKALAMLQRLPENLRSAVEAMVMRGLPSRAAAAICGVSYRQVQNRLKMALDVLRKQMETENPDAIDLSVMIESLGAEAEDTRPRILKEAV